MPRCNVCNESPKKDAQGTAPDAAVRCSARRCTPSFVGSPPAQKSKIALYAYTPLYRGSVMYTSFLAEI